MPDPARPRSSSRRGAALAAALLGLALAPPPVPAQGLRDLFMSPEQEKRVGAEEHERIVAQFGGTYDDPALAAYVDGLGQLLARTSEAPGVGYRFTVLDSPVVNAFALPGGYVYVTRGLLALAGDEAELAGVIAHEIGHVAARHGADRYSESVIANLGLAILGAATDNPFARGIAALGAEAILKSHSREDEFEADALGVRYLARAGFDPGAMARFLGKMEAEADLQARLAGGAPGSGLDFFATHPRTPERVARARSAAAALAVRDPMTARDIYLRKIDGLLFGDDPAQGIVEGRRFLHPDLGFELTFPPGFRVQNRPDQVLARDRSGAVVRLDADRRRGAGSMRRYVAAIWPRELPPADPEPLVVDGLEAATAAARVRGRRGPVDLRVVAIAYDRERIFRLLFLTPAERTPALSVELRRTTYSFRRLPPGAARDVDVLRVRLHRVAEGDTVASLAARMGTRELPGDWFRVLNGLGPREGLEPGRTVKLVVRERWRGARPADRAR